MSNTDEPHGQLDTGYPHALRPELHRALMARGIDYWVAQGITFWNRDDGCECLAYGYEVDGVPKLAIKVVGFTDPEQAIAATLGADDTYTREDVEGAFVSGYSLGLDMFDSSKPDSEKGWNQNERDMDEEMEELGWVRKDAATLGPTDPRERGLIPHFWTGDWTLHIEAARLPERIDVTLPDQRGREVYSARVHHFVPERTCHIEQTGHVKVAGVDYYDDDYECSECGAEMFEGYSFCPNCGRKVVDE